jgi:hypothetical protein
MTAPLPLALLAAFAFGGSAAAADLKAVDRTIRKEPAYRSKSPRYGLLVFGPEAKDRVWLVHDGDTLYVDRNGNGDLTGPGEAIPAKADKDRNPDEFGYSFEIGELRVGGRVHKGLGVGATPLTLYPDEIKNQPNAKVALAADPKARGYSVSLNVDRPGFRGMGIDDRTVVMAGPIDVNGALLFADKPADAPIIHLDGPLQVTVYGEKPTLKLERGVDFVLAVGTPGLGAGTLAMLAYQDTIPDAVVPHVEVLFPAVKADDPPVRELYELKERC